jgi:hypothetical protein
LLHSCRGADREESDVLGQLNRAVTGGLALLMAALPLAASAQNAPLPRMTAMLFWNAEKTP